jgi:hypothetical protein
MNKIIEDCIINHTDDLTDRRAYNICEYVAIFDVNYIVASSKNFEVKIFNQE